MLMDPYNYIKIAIVLGSITYSFHRVLFTEDKYFNVCVENKRLLLCQKKTLLRFKKKRIK